MFVARNLKILAFSWIYSRARKEHGAYCHLSPIQRGKSKKTAILKGFTIWLGFFLFSPFEGEGDNGFMISLRQKSSMKVVTSVKS